MTTHVVVITMRAKLVALLVIGHILPESLLAFFAQECHLHGLGELVCLLLRVAFGAVIPFLAARCSDGDLGVQNVFTGEKRV